MTESTEPLSAAEPANRAGVPIRTVDDLARAGVLRRGVDPERPFSPADLMRVELALATERDGIPRTELGAEPVTLYQVAMGEASGSLT